MSQKKRVRVYKPGQIDNSMNSWFMQMGGMPQQPQQQDMATQVMQYAQQMIMEGEDPNNVYDDLVNQGVPSQLAAQVIEQLMESMPPQPAYSQPTTAEAMYNQEVEEAEEEEAIPDFMDLAGL
jgi:DNA-binding protein Fis